MPFGRRVQHSPMCPGSGPSSPQPDWAQGVDPLRCWTFFFLAAGATLVAAARERNEPFSALVRATLVAGIPGILLVAYLIYGFVVTLCGARHLATRRLHRGVGKPHFVMNARGAASSP